MYEYNGRTSSTRRIVFIENGTRESHVYVPEWSGYESDLVSVSIDGSVATVELSNGIRKRFELDTGTNTPREL